MTAPVIPALAVSHSDAVDLLRRMLEIPSPSCAEAPLAAYLANAMTAMGYRTQIDPTGNVIGVIGAGEGPTVMLLGHMDTVPDLMPVRQEPDRLFGRGAVDAKGPLAAMIVAGAGAYRHVGRVVVIGVVEEETPSSRGAMAIRATHPPPDALIVGEPSGWSNVIIGYKGKLDLRYSVTVPGSHPTSPEPKATDLAIACWQSLVALLGPHASHASFAQPGATLADIVADLASARMDMSVRTPPGFDVDRLVADLRAGLPRGELEIVNAVAACRADRSNAAVRALSSGIRRLGAQPRLIVKTATSDMNTLAEVWDVPMATYGPGDSRLDHADDEHILLADYMAGIGVLASAIAELTMAVSPPHASGAQPSEGEVS
jgi:[amino group carrier protein]-lysine/ornithine hydrolase